MRLPWTRFALKKADFSEELQAHLALAVADRTERNETVAEANRNALRELGNIPMLAEVTRAMWGKVWLERLGQDAQYALRQIRRSPGFAATVVLTMSLGLGAAVAMYTVIDRVLLRTLPYDAPSSLVQVTELGKDGERGWGNAFLDIAEWQNRSHTLKGIAYYSVEGGPGHLGFLDGKGRSIGIAEATVSANLFSVLGTQAAVGRTFLEGDNGAVGPEDAHTILLSDAIWRNVFSADPHILGQSLRVSGERYTVIGVMPRGFTFPLGLEHPLVWVPLILTDADKVRTKHETPSYETIARLAPGSTIAGANREMNAIQRSVVAQYRDSDYRDHVNSIRLVRYGDTLVDDGVRKSLLALGGASTVLWLIACVNVTGLLLARATVRQREIAVRGALGAGRGRIIQQLLVEGLVLSGVAALLGTALAMLILRLFVHGLQTQFNIYALLIPNGRVLLALVMLTIISAMASSLWPAIVAARVPIETSLRKGSPQGGSGHGRQKLRTALVVTEIALSLTLLFACGLLLRTIYSLQHVPLGFRTDHVVVASMTIPNYKYAGRDLYKDLYDPLLSRVQGLPGIESASLMTEVPLGKNFRMTFTFGDDGKGVADMRRSKMRVQTRAVTPAVQKVFQFDMLKGRFFNNHDTATSLPVAVVNREFVRQYQGDDSDPGKFIGTPLMDFRKGKPAIVVGVLNDERQDSITGPPMPELEVCMPQITPDSMFYEPTGMAMDIAVRTRRQATTVIPELRSLMRQASPELENGSFTTMEQIVEDSYGSQQLASHLLEIFGGAALVLCIAGIYGLLAYLVTQRTHELGVRLALGAQRARLMSMILREAAAMLILGIAVGLLFAYVTSRFVGTLLYGVKPHDPWTMAAVALILLFGGLTTAFIPARRAAGINPMVALRSE